MSQSKNSTTGKLWQIFFDDEPGGIDSAAAASDTRRTSTSMKKTIIRSSSFSKAIPAASHHGVIYEGLLEEETDSEEELTPFGARGGQGYGSAVEEPPDLCLGPQKETVLYQAPPRRGSASSTNGVPNFKAKAFNASDWEPMVGPPKPPRQPIPVQGARFIIRSESDLELAIPSTKKTRLWKKCYPCSNKLDKWHNSCACLFIIGLLMTTIYILVVLAIVYGLR